MCNCRCTFCGFALHITTLSSLFDFSGMLRRRMSLIYLRHTSLLFSSLINLIFRQQCPWDTTHNYQSAIQLVKFPAVWFTIWSETVFTYSATITFMSQFRFIRISIAISCIVLLSPRLIGCSCSWQILLPLYDSYCIVSRGDKGHILWDRDIHCHHPTLDAGSSTAGSSWNSMTTVMVAARC